MDLVGRTLGKYRIVAELGRGGMGVVYRAFDPTLEREVAIKVLAPHLVWEKEFVQRFLREARAAAKLDHQNIVHIYEVGQEGDLYYFVMAYLPGRSLSQMVAERGPLPLPEVIAIAEQIAAALDYAHKRGLVHRDVKSSNILVDEEGRAVLTDFGIVRAASGTRLAATGTALGTPEYMSPEQSRGEEATAASDLYSLGIVVYEMLGGDVPFHATTPPAVLVKHMLEAAPSLRARNPRLPEAVERVVLWALAKDPRDRPRSGAEFVQALQAAAEGRVEKEATVVMPAALTPPPAAAPPTGAVRVAAGNGEMGRGAGVRGPRRFPPWAWALVGLFAVALAVGLALLIPRFGGPISPPDCTAVGQTRERAADGMTMVCVPAGEFLMGSSDADPDADSGEKPQHTVYLDAYWIDRTEVTVAQFRRFVQATGHQTTAEQEGWGWAYVTGQGWEQVSGADWQHPNGPGSTAEESHPVVQVSWNDAQAYCAWAGGALPTEAQWEKAARGTEGLIYPWGNDFACSRGNFDDETVVDPYVVPGGAGCDGYDRTAPVGSFASGASPYGAVDMAGNVWEWTADWYGAYSSGRQANPTGPASGNYRVLRGGSWLFTTPANLRAANRDNVHPGSRYVVVGFRCVVAQGR